MENARKGAEDAGLVPGIAEGYNTEQQYDYFRR